MRFDFNFFSSAACSSIDPIDRRRLLLTYVDDVQALDDVETEVSLVFVPVTMIMDHLNARRVVCRSKCCNKQSCRQLIVSFSLMSVDQNVTMQVIGRV